jgi:hypothetical protein
VQLPDSQPNRLLDSMDSCQSLLANFFVRMAPGLNVTADVICMKLTRDRECIYRELGLGERSVG